MSTPTTTPFPLHAQLRRVLCVTAMAWGLGAPALRQRPAPGGPLLIEVRAYRDRHQAESDAVAGAGKAETATLVEVSAWFPFRACLRSLKPAARRPIQLPRPRLAA